MGIFAHPVSVFTDTASLCAGVVRTCPVDTHPGAHGHRRSDCADSYPYVNSHVVADGGFGSFDGFTVGRRHDGQPHHDPADGIRRSRRDVTYTPVANDAEVPDARREAVPCDQTGR